MQLTTTLLLIAGAVSAAATAAPPDESAYYIACYAPGGPCTKLDQAISAGRGLLHAPSTGEHDEHTKRAADYLSAALDAAADPSVQTFRKRAPLPGPEAWRSRLCGWVGAPCGKVRRSAEAIVEILGDADMQKRWAEPEAKADPWGWRLCPWVGAPCGKARRSIDHLVESANEVLKAIPAKV